MRTTLTQQIYSNSIIIPQANDEIRLCCNQQEVQQLPGPVLIKLPSNCSSRINQITFDSSKQTLKTSPLLLPKIQLPETVKLPQYQPLKILDPQLEGIEELKHLVQHPDPLVPVNLELHSYSSIIPVVIIGILVIITYWYRRFKCATFKRRPTKIPELASIEEQNELQMIHTSHFSKLPSFPW